MKWILIVVLAIGVGVAFTAVAAAEEYEQEMWEIAAELACPVCSGQSVKDSNAPLARQIRALIVEKLEAGEDREAIVQFLVGRYGEGIRLDPPKSGFQLGVWLGPLVIIGVALGMVATVLWRRGRVETAPAGLDDFVARVDAGLARRREGEDE